MLLLSNKGVIYVDNSLHGPFTNLRFIFKNCLILYSLPNSTNIQKFAKKKTILGQNIN